MTTLVPQYYQGTTNAVNKPFNYKLGEWVSVFDFLTPTQISAVQSGSNTADLSTAISSAIATGKAVYFPAGTYLCNVTINNKTILFGDGSHVSILMAYNIASPIMLYGPTTYATPSPTIFWSYHSVVRNLGFQGVVTGGNPTGIGFAFGSADPATYVTNAEFASNVTFYNCFFQYLNKGVMFPFGNIGTSFYSCGFQSNYYGVYSKSNNSGSGSIMHAGNKYFYNGEVSGNTCGIYFDNQIDGFGGVGFTDVIFEQNINAVYINDTTNAPVLPPMFKDCWNEGNGALCSTSGNAVVDTWISGVKGTTNIGRYCFVLFGKQFIFDGGFVSGISFGSPNSNIFVKNARVENNPGLNGQEFSVSNANSSIQFENCISGSGFSSTNQQCLCVGVNHDINYDVTGTYYSSARAYYIPVSYNKVSSTGLSGLSNNFINAVSYTGSLSGTGVQFTDGTKFSPCNQFNITFSSTSQYIYFSSLNNACVNGTYYVATVDVKCTSGAIQVQVGDFSANQMGIKPIFANARWSTVAFIGYFPNNATMSLSVLPYGNSGVGTNVFEIGGYQIYQFPTQIAAEQFIAQNTFVS